MILYNTIGSLLDHYFCGVNGYCTDICVISNAMVLRAAFPETEIEVLSDCCAGVTPQSHQTALDAMRACQFTIIS